MPKPVVPLFVLPDAEYQALASDSEKQQFLGNYMYQFIQKYVETNHADQNSEEQAGKITGMILEGHNLQFVLCLFKDKSAFYSIVKEAVALLQKSTPAN